MSKAIGTWLFAALLLTAGCASRKPPLVMLLFGTSGSMELVRDCTCSTPGCVECYPDCAKRERSRWLDLAETLSGSIRGYACEQQERTSEDDTTYDYGYYLPHTVSLSPEQNEDGLLDVHRDSVRFGMAMFDAWDTYFGEPPLVPLDDFDFAKSAGKDGQWSYNPERALGKKLIRSDGTRIGVIDYPNVTTQYYMDEGIRGPQALRGKVQAAFEPAQSSRVNQTMQRELMWERPYGGRPTAAAFDDLYYFMKHAQQDSAERDDTEIVLITDGAPDPEYRDYGCNCAHDEDPSGPHFCSNDPSDPSKFQCPYPRPEDAARTLRCGQGIYCTGGVAKRVHVIAYDVYGGDSRYTLDRIAEAGGTSSAREADGPAQLRSQLEAILREAQR
jgi:hypothetical protein